MSLLTNMFWATVCKTVRPMLSDRCPVLSVCNVGVLWPNGWPDQDETWHAGRPRPGHIVLDGDPAPPAPKRHSPQFSAHICCSQMAAWIKMPLGMELGLGPSDYVLDGDPALPSPKREHSPQFSAHVYYDQTAGWIKMVLGMEIGLSPGDFVLDGDPAPPPKGGSPAFGPLLLWPNGWMYQDATWYGGKSQPTQLFVRWGPSPPLNFRPMFIIVIVISLEHCTLLIGLFKFKFKF